MRSTNSQTASAPFGLSINKILPPRLILCPGSNPLIEPIESRLLLSAAVHHAIHHATHHLAIHVSKSIETTAKVKTAVAHFPTLKVPVTDLPVEFDKTEFTPANTGVATPTGGITPAQMAGAYLGTNTNYFGVTADGTGQTIAIVDSFDDPGMVNSTAANFSSSDLAQFDAYYGLPNPPSFIKYGVDDNTGLVTTTLPGTDPSGPYSQTGNLSTAVETSLDVEWAHAMAPNANIVLLETTGLDTAFNGIQAADSLAGVNVVSMSFSTDEANVGSDEPDYDSFYFENPGITYLAATGDYGAYGTNGGESTSIEPQYPASAPDVVGVGGTSLTVSGNNWAGESTWGNGTSSGTQSGSGGGTSLYIPKPSYQSAVSGAGGNRQLPDVSLDGNPNTGVAVYDTYDFGAGTAWFAGLIGGTSLATPLMAGLVADADQGRALDSLPTLSSNTQPGSVDIHSLLYSLASSATNYANDFHDITTGNAIGPAGAPPNYSPETGYDLASGIGSPVANHLVFDLTGLSSTPAASQPGINNLYYRQDSTSNSSTDVWVNSTTPGVGSPTYIFNDAEIASLTYVGGSGNDSFTLDLSAGTTLEANPLVLNMIGSASGSNSLTIIGASTGTTAFTATASSVAFGDLTAHLTNVATVNLNPRAAANTLLVNGSANGNDSFTVTSSSVQIDGTTFSFTNLSAITLNPGAGTDALTVNSGSATVAAQSPGLGILTRNFSSISIAVAGSALFATAPLHTDRTLIQTTSLTVLGQLDLGGNDMVIHNGNLTAITALLATGYANGQWNGNGIASTAAHGDSTHRTALGAIQSATGQPTFDGISPLATDVLIKYTYYGDTNLDGKVDGSDYSRIDNAFISHATGWGNGDFNYDGSVNGSDYALIDNLFNVQGTGM